GGDVLRRRGGAGGDAPPERALHGGRPRHDRPRPVGQAARRLLPGRLRRGSPRPAGCARLRACLGRGAFVRGRHRDAVRLPLPRVRRANGADQLGRPGAGGSPDAQSGGAARRRGGGGAAGAGGAGGAAAGSRAPEEGPVLPEFARGYASLTEEGASDAFVHTMRNVIDHEGQRVSALDRLYLADQVPTLIVWGSSDPIIPV